MIYYCCKGINPIKISVSKLVFEEQKKEHIHLDTMQPFNIKAKSEKSHKSSKSKKKKQNKSTKDFNPPKKARVKKTNNNNSFERKKQKGDLKLLDIVNKKRRSIKNKQIKDDESVKSDKVRKRKSIIDYQAEMVLRTRENLLRMEDQKLENKIEDEKQKKVSFNPNSHIYKSKEEKSQKEKIKKKQDQYDNYEYNHMSYHDASELDKRTCLRTYWSVVLREHYVIFTFLSRNDYNLFYVKIERFFILICTEMTMNGMFFLHETMYRKKTGGITFAQKLPQIIFSLIVTHIMEIILCFLGMTDTHYYEIKALPKLNKYNTNNETIENFFRNEKREKDFSKKYQNAKNEKDNKIFNILNCIERKLTAFFVFTFLVFLFHWYFISAFCAVYQNTQKIFLRDSGIAILTSLIDPFIIYGITCILRAISLTLCCRKKLSCIYKTSELIPIF